MAEPGDPAGLAAIVHRWAARLAGTEGVALTSSRLEEILGELAQEAVASVEATREAAAKRFSALYTASPIGIALADQDGTIIEVNPAMARFLEYRSEQLHGRTFVDLGFGDRDRQQLADGLAELAETEAEHVRQRVQLTHSDDAAVWAEITLARLPGDRPRITFPVLMAVDANDLHTLQETLRHQSGHDPLTGLSNASRFHTMLENALSPTARDQVALIYLDLDGFRVINDGLGTGIGDKVLKGVAGKLRAVFTSHQALVARLSGDGFGILLRGRLTRSEVTGLLDRAMEDLGEPIFFGEQGVGVSASAGIVVRGVSEGGPEELRRAAELALHRAKEAGRAQWMLFDPERDAIDRARYRLGAEIAGALEHGQFDLVYHPMVDLGEPGGLSSVTAGLVWRHPELGELDTCRFYQLVETTGMTMPLGKWLLSEALGSAARWHQKFGDKAPDICIRLPYRLASDPDLVKLIREQLGRHELPASVLRLCIEPTTFVDRDGEVLDSLILLAELGAKPALTVTGSADLELIARHDLPVGYIALDGGVIDALAEGEEEPAARHLCHLLARARELNLFVGAANVRSAEHAERLCKHGVQAARGPFAGSCDDDEIDEFIERHTN
ncbi:MAG TPA: diguanylate cyclase [Amycolatopsis sp.]|uniref:diguanylate cyclase domain-containing protein n=1 Tax=Amycolatopsis sp. TaxID=37632 RepID=UPI002B46C2D6|nr:diguanylate cyclase [Amycolatopsis sp.]HKS49929.1 diguanylate cyclase [Amycolatopsis sp.]